MREAIEEETDLDAGWRKIQLTYFHAGREPKFSCETKGPQLERQPIPSAMLSISNRGTARMDCLGIAPCGAITAR